MAKQSDGAAPSGELILLRALAEAGAGVPAATLQAASGLGVVEFAAAFTNARTSEWVAVTGGGDQVVVLTAAGEAALQASP